jgi:hypothetical protein
VVRRGAVDHRRAAARPGGHVAAHHRTGPRRCRRPGRRRPGRRRLGEDDWDADPPSPEGIGDLASLDLSRIVDLDVSYLRLGPLGAQALAVASFVHLDPAEERIGDGRVETLDLRYCYIGDAGLAAVAESSTFRNVRRLHLQANRITATGVAALNGFERLEVLDLRYNDLGAAGA